jgi:hypothetical protein
MIAAFRLPKRLAHELLVGRGISGVLCVAALSNNSSVS